MDRPLYVPIQSFNELRLRFIYLKRQNNLYFDIITRYRAVINNNNHICYRAFTVRSHCISKSFWNWTFLVLYFLIVFNDQGKCMWNETSQDKIAQYFFGN